MTELSAFIDASVPPSGAGCVECEQTGAWWVHLRRCALCGHVSCCDDSLNKHASTHFHDTGHRIMQSFEPGEDWFWDYVSDSYADGPQLAPAQSHPASQSVPGPAERLPENWRELLADDRRGG